MPKFSYNSNEHLGSCCRQLQQLFKRVIQEYDCTIIEGHRGESTQNEYYRTGRSKLQWPNSRHNRSPSTGVDVAPYPIDWNDSRRFYHFAGYVIATAHSLDFDVTFGGDWDGDFAFSDQTFFDLVHFQYNGPLKRPGD